MIVDREQLLAALTTIKPALAARDTIEQLTLVWFDGKTITASNEAGFGMQVPFEVAELKGGLKGTVLLAVMSNSRAKDVNIEKDEQGLFIKAGRTRLNLPLTPRKEMLAEVPDTSGPSFHLTLELIMALGRTTINSGDIRSAVPEQAGITLICKDDFLYVFSSDAATIACSKIPVPKNFPLKSKERVVLSCDFVSELLTISRGVTDTQIHIGKEILWAKNNKALIFGRSLTVQDPINLVEIMNKTTAQITFTPTPGRLKLALVRAEALIAKEDLIEFSIVNSILKLDTKSAAGLLKDTMKLEGEQTAPEVETKLNPRLLKRALLHTTQIGFGANTSAMRDEKTGFTYLISSSK